MKENINKEIFDLILYDTIRWSLEYTKSLKSSFSTVSSINFNLCYTYNYNELKEKGFKENFFKLATKELLYNYNTDVNELSFEEVLNKYKEYNQQEKNKSNDYNYNMRRYKNLSNEDKKILDELLISAYNDLEEGYKYDNYLFEYYRKIYEYIKKLKEIFGDSFVDKINNIKMFALGIYNEEDYKLVTDYCNNLYKELNKKYDLSYREHTDQRFINKLSFHDEYYDIIIKDNEIEFHDEYRDILIKDDKVEFGELKLEKLCFTNAKILNYDKIKEQLNNIGEGIVYNIFKYNNGKYLGVFNFIGLDDLLLIEFEDFITIC